MRSNSFRLLLLDDESPISANLRNNHGFINKEYSLHWVRRFGEAQTKAIRAYAQSGQYHIIVESRVRLTVPIIIMKL